MARLKNMNTAKGFFIASLMLSLGLAGCGGFNGAENIMHDVTQVHPITVESDVATLNIAVAPGQPGLLPGDRAAIADFATAYRQRGHGALSISAPSGSPNSGAATAVLSDVRNTLFESGLTNPDLAYTPYRASAAERTAPLILSFRRYVAKPSACGNWSRDYGYDPSNGRMPNHGCATQNNLAAMIADPSDLLGTRPLGPADAGRRTTVIEKYRAGEPTAATRTGQDGSSVSGVGQ